MATRERRQITLLDIMVLAVATAIGLAVSRFGWPLMAATAWIFTWPVAPNKMGGYPSKTWVLPYAERAAPLLPCLAAWTGAFLVTRLHGHRPR